MRLSRENITGACLFVSILTLSVWLQFWLLEEYQNDADDPADHEFDYYMEKVTMTGADARGVIYHITSDRMEHYPAGDRIVLDNPVVTRYDQSGDPQEVSADSGWFDNLSGTVLLTGNVRAAQRDTQGADSIATSQQMTIHLDDRKD